MKFSYHQALDAVIEYSDTLKPEDFDENLLVSLSLQDGSHFNWVGAFCLEVKEEASEDPYWLAVFTRHSCQIFDWDEISVFYSCRILESEKKHLKLIEEMGWSEELCATAKVVES